LGLSYVIMIGTAALWISATGAAGDRSSTWNEDFRHQPPSRRPMIEARYADASRTGLVIEAQRYTISVDLRSEDGQRIRDISISGDRGATSVLTGKGAYLELTDSHGTTYSSLNTKTPSRINIYRRGPYYIETHWLDIELSDSEGKVAPIKGEVVFYSYPEKTHIGVTMHVTQSIEIKSAAMVIEMDGLTCAGRARNKYGEIKVNDFWLVRRAGNAPSCALIYPVPRGLDDVVLEKIDHGIRITHFIHNAESHRSENASWDSGSKKSGFLELFPLINSEVSAELEAEVTPILSSCFSATKGRALGYDPVRGCYKVQTDNPGGFAHHFENPNDYEIAEFAVHNLGQPRKIYIMHETRMHPGTVECGIVLDDEGWPLPIAVQTSKNFSCEIEEPFYNPQDTAFSETFFPLYLGEDEKRRLSSLHIYQNWGIHPLKQFSSLGAWMDYYHMSTGVTETTCYVPFLFGGLTGVHIADFRPMSQKMWESQPQHDNVAGHSFLRYLDARGIWHFIEYRRTLFRSTGPNWADVRMEYLSDDGKVRVTLDIFEVPQKDELRNFVRMRVDFLDDVDIKDGDFARNMRLLNIASWVQGMRYTHLAYGGPTGEASVVPIKLNDDFTLLGAVLPSPNGFAAIYPDVHGANAFMVSRFVGQLDGAEVLPGVSLIGQKNGDTVLMLVPITKAKTAKKDDYIEASIVLMPYGVGTQDWKPAQKLALDYGLNQPKVTQIACGTKLDDFPTRIRLDANGNAEFCIAGGMDYIPIIVEGAKDYHTLRLYNIDGEKYIIDQARPNHKDGYQVFVCDDGSFGSVFLVTTDGKEHRYKVESRQSDAAQ